MSNIEGIGFTDNSFKGQMTPRIIRKAKHMIILKIRKIFKEVLDQVGQCSLHNKKQGGGPLIAHELSVLG